MSLSSINATRTDYTKRIKDVMGRLKISKHQNIYDADFEYGKQPMRWDEITANGGTITHLGGAGGCAMFLPSGATNPAALTVRQSRPYHRYQPGKSMFMATAVNFGTPATDQFQRVGFFDDSNGIFFEQGAASTGNPAGMKVVVRSDTNYYPNGTASTSAVRDVKIDFTNWTDPHGIKTEINWSLIQMLWLEYAWYGAGCLRWGVLINGEPFILHEIGSGNNSSYGGGVIGGASSTGVAPWARTGNLPVRYEQRDSGVGAPATTMYHYGVSVIIEGEYDEQRGFTYSYGMDSAVPRRYVAPNSVRFPVLSIQARTMGTQEFSHIGGPAVGQAKISSSTVSTLSVLSAGYDLPRIRTFDVNASLTTVTFQRQHNLPATGQITLSGFTPSALNATFNYTILSASSITFTNSTAATTIGKATTTGVVWDTNQWVGRSVYFLANDGRYYMGKITANTGQTITFCDPLYVESSRVLPSAPSVGTTYSGQFTINNKIVKMTSTAGLSVGQVITSAFVPQSTAIVEIPNATTIVLNNSALASTVGISGQFVIGSYFVIGQVNRGQLLPKQLVVSSDALSVVELITSAPENPVVLTASDFQPLSQLGSANSFATRDVLATSVTPNSGEVVYAFTTPTGGGGLQTFNLTDFFPLYNSITGSIPDMLTVAVSTRATAQAGGQVHQAFGRTGTFTGTLVINSPIITAVSSVANLYVGQAVSGTGIPAGSRITKIFQDTVSGTNQITISANATVAGAQTITWTIGILTFIQPHGLSVGDTITLSGFNPNDWNTTHVVANVNDLVDVTILPISGIASAAGVGDAIFSVGSNVGAHIICQEAMS